MVEDWFPKLGWILGKWLSLLFMIIKFRLHSILWISTFDTDTQLPP